MPQPGAKQRRDICRSNMSMDHSGEHGLKVA